MARAAQAQRSASEVQRVETLIAVREGASCIRENKKGDDL